MNNRPCTSIKRYHFRFILEPSFKFQRILTLCATECWELHRDRQSADIPNVCDIASKATKNTFARNIKDMSIKAFDLALDVSGKVSRSGEENGPHNGF